MKKMKTIIALGLICVLMGASSVAALADEDAETKSTSEAEVAESETAEEETAEETSKPAESVDLTGNWVQADAEGSEGYQVGYIKDGVIELYWVQGPGVGGTLYWSGSYEDPVEENGVYSWESVNDKIKTGYALLASQDDKKTFTYENGKIKYDVLLMGQNLTVTLVKSDLDYSEFKPVGGNATTALAGNPVEFVSGNYSWSKRGDDANCNLYYSIQIHNPNEEFAVKTPIVQVTARAVDGSILTTHEQALPTIAAGDTVTYGSVLSYEGVAPDKVEMIVSNDTHSYIHQEGSGVIRQDMLTVSNVSEFKGDIATTYTGEVTNNSTVDQSRVCVIVLFKQDGASIGGINSMIDILPSGATKPFEISLPKDHITDYDSYEVYALAW